MLKHALFCLPLIFLPALAQADQCEQLPKPSITVKRIDEHLSFNTRYSFRSLTNIGAATALPGYQVLGLTRGNATVQFAIKVPSFVDASGRWECASPQITLSFGFTPMTVYVAKEFPAGSCAYKEIYEHEMRHVKTYQSHLSDIEKDLTATLTTRFATDAPWRGPVGQTMGKLQRELDERWTPYVQREIKRVDAAQALIDTAEEYERIASSCNGEIKKQTH